MQSLASVVLARFIESAPITAPYLTKLIAFMEAENSSETSYYRGTWGSSIRYVQRWLRQLATDPTEVPKTVGEMIQWFESRSELDPAQITQLKEAIAMPRAVKTPKPTLDFYAMRRKLEQLTGKKISHQASLEARADVPERLAQVLHALKKLKPSAKRALNTVVRTISLVAKPRGSEDASWDGGGTMRLVIKEHQNMSVESWVYFITHELGHGLEEHHHIDSWGAGPWGHPPFISDYARSKPNIEDFAESYTAYVMEPAHLKAKAPTKFSALNELHV